MRKGEYLEYKILDGSGRILRVSKGNINKDGDWLMGRTQDGTLMSVPKSGLMRYCESCVPDDTCGDCDGGSRE